jgi:hypothetical protein
MTDDFRLGVYRHLPHPVDFFPFVSILAGVLLGPHKPGRVKAQIYECGSETRGPSRIQFHASYYLYALVFLIFDVEVVFLFPWAVAMERSPSTPPARPILPDWPPLRRSTPSSDCTTTSRF